MLFVVNKSAVLNPLLNGLVVVLFALMMRKYGRDAYCVLFVY